MRPPVYPRWRGEHEGIYVEGVQVGGLSPLARGTPISFEKIASNVRFIPAGAGNTLWEWSPADDVSVYPRWRGEH